MNEEQNLNNTKTQQLNITGVCSNVSDDYRINGSGLFYWNSELTKETKLSMLDWYDKLSDIEKQYIMNFRREAEMDEYKAHHNGEEL
jgi:hypothetical protein